MSWPADERYMSAAPQSQQRYMWRPPAQTQRTFVLFASLGLSVAGSDLGLQLFVRSWQHLAALRGEVQSWGVLGALIREILCAEQVREG